MLERKSSNANEPEPVAELLGGAPVISSEGRSFPVETRYLGKNPTQRLEDRMADAIQRAVRADTGSILAFLPGQGEIRRTEEMAHFLGQLYNREVSDDATVTVIRFSQIKP